MSTSNPVQISENCWKHIGGGCVFYTKTIERKSEYNREDGPAIEWENGTKEWCCDGKHHRVDGPAVEHANGDKYWYYNGERIDVNSQEEFEKYLNSHTCS